MSWHFLGIDLGRGDNILKVAAAIILPEVILAAGTEILAATEVASGFDFVSAVDAINSTTGLTGTEAAKIVGQSAFTAVATDGNLGDVLQNGLTAATGIQVDNIVTDAFDSALAGDVVRSATVAAIGNKDVGQAVALQLIPAGVGAAVGALTTGTRMDPLDYNLGNDVLIGLTELGVVGDVVIDDEALMQAGLDAAALVPDELGILYNVAGQWVQIPPEEWAAQLYAVPAPEGGFEVRDPANRVVLTTIETAGRSTEELQQLTLQKLQAEQGLTSPAGTPPAGRPANLTQPASQTTIGQITDYAKLAENLTKSFANIALTVRQVANGTYGRVPSPYGPTSPIGTLRPPQPGVPVRNVDGSITVNNGNGTQTKTLPNGQQITTPTSVAGAGAFGGISTNTLLLVGAGLAAALLLRRK
jgi:hypothetical protein